MWVDQNKARTESTWEHGAVWLSDFLRMNINLPRSVNLVETYPKSTCSSKLSKMKLHRPDKANPVNNYKKKTFFITHQK